MNLSPSLFSTFTETPRWKHYILSQHIFILEEEFAWQVLGRFSLVSFIFCKRKDEKMIEKVMNEEWA